jgi:diacylglycerol kinase (ATP)
VSLATLLVVNPESGGGRTGRVFGAMRPAIERALGAVDVVLTERRGHGIDLARAAADEGRELVVAVGGDGTFSEVVNGVMRAHDAGARTRVGLIAQGTGGDFRRTLGLEHRLDRYLEALGSGRERKIDIGRLRYKDDDGHDAEHYFVNILSAGMGGLVDRYVADERVGGNASGKTKYMISSLRALATMREGHLRCQVTRGGAREERRFASYMIAICNGRFFGSGMHVAPMAEIDDGRFEVVNMTAPSRLAFALVARKIYDGSHLRETGVSHFSCDRIELALENADAHARFLLDVDGEPMGGLPIAVDLLRSAITLRA